MVVKLTQEQADYLKTFEDDDKNKAFHFISSWGWGEHLRDGLGKFYKKEEEKPFEINEKEKMLNALINGYEVVVPKYKFHNVCDFEYLYYAGKRKQLTYIKDEAFEVKKDSDEYKALIRVGFIPEKV